MIEMRWVDATNDVDKVPVAISGIDINHITGYKLQYRYYTFIVTFPLVEWGMGREECLQTICKAGLPSPGKSACFFCPSSKPHEVRKLAVTHPDLMERALAMEANAQENLTSVKGLGRNWAWKDLLATDDMFEEEYHQTVDIACGCYDG